VPHARCKRDEDKARQRPAPCRAHDGVRDKWLVERNYRLLRFWNNDVLLNMAGVLETIVTALAEAPPHPDR
jgi:very-short-patch-repair endonuclease